MPPKLQFVLRQHTPIIHFQHEQTGATLRASELKPKLDRFIIKEIGFETAKRRGWLVGKGDHPALDYKVKVLPVRVDKKEIRRGRRSFIPPFFADMGNEYDAKPKGLTFSQEEIMLSFFSFKEDLLNHIETTVAIFFATVNFGTRQSKGFGSFTIKSKIILKDGVKAEELIPFPADEFSYFFDLGLELNRSWVDRYKTIFRNVDTFYRTIRSGINIVGNGGDFLYFKSALFLYLHAENIQWDKKSIKGTFLDLDDINIVEETRNGNREHTIEYLATQAGRHRNPEILTNIAPQNENGDLKLWRDLLGLSLDESWYSYRFDLKKREGKRLGNRWTEIRDDSQKRIQRFKSPILFKPVLQDDTIRIYFDAFVPPNIEQYYDTNFIISIKHKTRRIQPNLRNRDNGNLRLQIPEGFDFQAFFNYSFRTINPVQHISYMGNSEEIVFTRTCLINIYNQLRNQIAPPN